MKFFTMIFLAALAAAMQLTAFPAFAKTDAEIEAKVDSDLQKQVEETMREIEQVKVGLLGEKNAALAERDAIAGKYSAVKMRLGEVEKQLAAANGENMALAKKYSAIYGKLQKSQRELAALALKYSAQREYCEKKIAALAPAGRAASEALASLGAVKTKDLNKIRQSLPYVAATVRHLAIELAQVKYGMQAVSAFAAGLQERAQAIEKLSGRLDAVEADVDGLKTAHHFFRLGVAYAPTFGKGHARGIVGEFGFPALVLPELSATFGGGYWATDVEEDGRGYMADFSVGLEYVARDFVQSFGESRSASFGLKAQIVGAFSGPKFPYKNGESLFMQVGVISQVGSAYVQALYGWGTFYPNADQLLPVESRSFTTIVLGAHFQ